MLASIITSLKTKKVVPETYRGRWTVLIGLMFFFLSGYLTFVVVQLMKINLPTEFVTGVVFLGGAVFVFLILKLTRSTIAKVKMGEQLLRNAHDQLEIRVKDRTRDLQKALVDLEKESIEREKTAIAFEKVNEELLQILNSAADGIRVIGTDFVIQRANRTFAEMIGVPEDKLPGMHCYDTCNGPDCQTENCSLNKILNGASQVEEEVVIQGKGGRDIPCILTAFPYYNSKGDLVAIVEGFRDISGRKEMEKRLEEMSVTDELTGLLNRRGFLSLAGKQLQIGERVDSSIYLLYADIDNMKWINDNLGHTVGDQALKEAADVLRATFRKSDVIGIGRLGGDEFAVLMFSNLEGCCDHPVLKRLEDQIAERNSQTDRDYTLSISVGIVRYEEENALSLEEFMSLGDAAMYHCKRTKKAALTQANKNTA